MWYLQQGQYPQPHLLHQSMPPSSTGSSMPGNQVSSITMSKSSAQPHGSTSTSTGPAVNTTSNSSNEVNKPNKVYTFNQFQWESIDSPLILDSGAPHSICSIDYSSDYPLCTTESTGVYRDASNSVVHQHGDRVVLYELFDNVYVWVKYRVCSTSSTLLSLADLVKKEFSINFNPQGSILEFHGFYTNLFYDASSSQYQVRPLRRVPFNEAISGKFYIPEEVKPYLGLS